MFCCRTYLPLASLIKGPAAVGGNNRIREAGFQSLPAAQKTCWHLAHRITASVRSGEELQIFSEQVSHATGPSLAAFMALLNRSVASSSRPAPSCLTTTP